jgi:hypothetical protein
VEARWKRRRGRRAPSSRQTPLWATRGKGGGSGRGGCSSHIGNKGQCGSDTIRRSAIFRSRGPRLYCYETETRRNGGKANGTKKKKIRRGGKGKARKPHVNSTSQDQRATPKKKWDADSTGARQWEGTPLKFKLLMNEARTGLYGRTAGDVAVDLAGDMGEMALDLAQSRARQGAARDEAKKNKERPERNIQEMNTASKLGPHTQTDRGTCPGVGL